jgi:hypothetical protein
MAGVWQSTHIAGFPLDRQLRDGKITDIRRMRSSRNRFISGRNTRANSPLNLQTTTRSLLPVLMRPEGERRKTRTR